MSFYFFASMSFMMSLENNDKNDFYLCFRVRTVLRAVLNDVE